MSAESSLDYRGNRLIAIAVSFTVLNTLFLVLRFFGRFSTRDYRLGWDDFFVCVAYVCTMGLCAMGFVFVYYCNAGYHFRDAVQRDPNTLSTWLKCIFSLTFIYIGALSASKLAILCLYVRIFGKERRSRWVLWILISIVAAYWVAFYLVSCFLCIPLRAYWDFSVHGRCINDTTGSGRYSGILSIIIDLPILAFPVWQLRKMNMSLARKVGLGLIFTTGNLGMIACIARLILFSLPDAFSDLTWSGVYLVGMTIVEPSMYLIANCLMAMRPLAKAAYGAVSRFRSSRSDRSSQTNLKDPDARRGYITTTTPPPSSDLRSGTLEKWSTTRLFHHNKDDSKTSSTDPLDSGEGSAV